MTLRVSFLAASEGDAIWITWGPGGRHRMIVDMGRTAAGREIRSRIDDLDPEDRIELLVVTHVDADHIEGVLAGLVRGPAIDHATFRDVWFNGRTHLVGGTVARPSTDVEPLGPRQGDELSHWLEPGPWNERFERGPVVRTNPLTTETLADGMRVTVVGPTQDALGRLVPDWDAVVEQAEAGLTDDEDADPDVERMGARPAPEQPTLDSWEDVDRLATTDAAEDVRPANGTSICVILEWAGRRVLLTGDAHPSDVAAGVRAFAAQQGPPLATPVWFDLVEVPHHGSAGNLSEELLGVIACPTWAFSTNGTKHFHPHAPTIARLVRRHRTPRPHLVFNVPSAFNRWWTEGAWPDRFGYTTQCGSTAEGTTVSLPRPHSEPGG